MGGRANEDSRWTASSLVTSPPWDVICLGRAALEPRVPLDFSTLAGVVATRQFIHVEAAKRIPSTR